MTTRRTVLAGSAATIAVAAAPAQAATDPHPQWVEEWKSLREEAQQIAYRLSGLPCVEIEPWKPEGLARTFTDEDELTDWLNRFFPLSLSSASIGDAIKQFRTEQFESFNAHMAAFKAERAKTEYGRVLRQLEKRVYAMHDLEDRVTETPATTFEGLQAQIDMVMLESGPQEGIDLFKTVVTGIPHHSAGAYVGTAGSILIRLKRIRA